MKTRLEHARDRVKDIGEIKKLSDMSALDMRILGLLTAAQRLNGTGYLAGWTIGEMLGMGRAWLDCHIPGTEGDDAMNRLIAAGLVEELEDLHYRYRIKKEATP